MSRHLTLMAALTGLSLMGCSQGVASHPVDDGVIPGRGEETAWWERIEESESSTTTPSTTLADENGDTTTTTPLVPELEFSVPSDVLFAPDSDVISPDGRDQLLVLCENRFTGAVRIRIVGHTDSLGSNNDELGLARAAAARDVLVGACIDGSIIEVDTRGSGEPVADESGPDPDEARARNRRIEIYVTMPAS